MINIRITERGYPRREWEHRSRAQDYRTGIDRAITRIFGPRARFESDKPPFVSANLGTIYTGRVNRRVNLDGWTVLAYINIRITERE